MEDITISFGPSQQYLLRIPVTAENKLSLLHQLQAAVEHLKDPPVKKPKKYLPFQQVFSFCK